VALTQVSGEVQPCAGSRASARYSNGCYEAEPMMTHLDDAMRLASLGWPVFPCEKDKTPVGEIVERGHLDATTHPRRIQTWWKIRPDALVGVAIPKGTIALDVDDVEAFTETGLPLDELPGQQTPRGGYHRFARADQEVKQTIKRIPGLDTRVGGKGYVIAWQPDSFPSVDQLPGAPDWVYERLGVTAQEKRIEGIEATDADLLLGADGATHREDLIAYAGRLRWAGATTNEIFLALVQAREDGRIVDGRPEDPWTDEHFKQIATEMGKKKGPDKAPILQITKVKHVTPAEVPDKRVSAADLLDMEFPPLQYVVEELMPEGLGIIAAPPKAGKSWMVLQAGVEAATGGELFGRHANPRPVLYYALEDGERRMKGRLQAIIGARKVDLGWLEPRWDARPLGDGFEEDIARFFDDNMEYGPGLVIVDVLAKVRKASKGKDNAYNEDYSTMKPLHDIVRDPKRAGCCIFLVTHTRKASVSDWISGVQGTHGVVGAADWVWSIERERMQPEAKLHISGRDIFEQTLNIVHSGTGAWTLSGVPTTRTKSVEQQLILDTLLTEGDLAVMEIVEFLYPDVLAADEDPATSSEDTKKAVQTKRSSINEKLVSLEEQRLVKKAGRLPGTPAYIWHALSEDERNQMSAQATAKARAASPDTGFTVRRVPSRVRAE